MKAVVKINGSQILVTPGQEVTVNRLNQSSPLVFPEVLLTISDTDIAVGNPFLPEVSVTAEKLSDLKGEKVRTFKFKSKSRYRKTTGFRPQLTKLKIVSIGKSVDTIPTPVKPSKKPVKARAVSEKKS